MKRAVVLAIAVLLCSCFVFSGCTGTYEKSPDQYKKIRWITPDYSFRIYPDNDCKGMYKFNGKKYNIQAKFQGTTVYVYDTDNKNAELFNADWMYEDEMLHIYSINFNSKDYKAFETNYAEFVDLQKEKVK
jgi:hypothetical protein